MSTGMKIVGLIAAVILLGTLFSGMHGWNGLSWGNNWGHHGSGMAVNGHGHGHDENVECENEGESETGSCGNKGSYGGAASDEADSDHCSTEPSPDSNKDGSAPDDDEVGSCH